MSAIVEIDIRQPANTQVFLVKSALIITGVAMLALTPFSINNFIQGRTLLGFGSGTIVLLCALNTWNCMHDRYQPLLILLGLAPVIVVFLWFACHQLGVIGVLWSYPAAMSFYFLLPERQAWAANIVLVGAIAPEAWMTLDQPLAIRVVATLLATSVFAGVFIRFITRQQLELEAIAVRDPLTGLFNRTLLQEDLERALQQSHRTGSAISILMVDIDHFKNVNDTFGHQTGDEVLHEVGDFLTRNTRAADTVFRIGGEEFLVLLYDTKLKGALGVAEKMRGDIETLQLLPNHHITISIGVAELHRGETVDDWMKRADDYLYEAKTAGRNKVYSAPIPEEGLHDAE